jgi:SAM-dependent methyltransferase
VTDHTSAVLDYFDTDAYLIRNPIVPIRARLVSELLSGLRGGRVLDLGCGDGSVSRPLLANNNHLTLLDLSEAMLERAGHATGGMTRYLHADALTWRPDGFYDAVLCIGLVAHVDSPARLLEQAAGATRPGGRCIVQITDVGRPLGWLLTRYGRLRRREGYPLNELTGRQLVALAIQHDLRPVAACRYGLLVPLTGRLPYRGQAWLEERFASGLLSRAAAELLVVFEKATQT